MSADRAYAERHGITLREFQKRLTTATRKRWTSEPMTDAEAAVWSFAIDGVELPPPERKPDNWPEKCGSCGASWREIGFDYADGFNCRKCGRTDADE